jgi:transcription-repair coupling factor (superfamily II helicase)
VYQGSAGSTAKVLARGLGALSPAQQVEQLMEWLFAMAAQIPEADGLSADQRQQQQAQRDAEVLVV